MITDFKSFFPLINFILLKEDNTLSAAQLAKQLGVTARTIQRDLEKLSKAERIKHIGPDKGGHWEVL